MHTTPYILYHTLHIYILNHAQCTPNHTHYTYTPHTTHHTLFNTHEHTTHNAALRTTHIRWGETIAVKTNRALNSELLQGVALGCDDVIMVADTGNHRIQVLSKEGQYLRSFGGLGVGAGANFTCILSLHSLVQSSFLPCLCPSSSRLVVVAGITRYFAGVCYVYAMCLSHAPLLRCLPLIHSASCSYFSLASLDNTLSLFFLLLLSFHSSGQFDEPEGVAVDVQRGVVAVTDKGNTRVQVFDELGNCLHIIKDFKWLRDEVPK